MDQTRSHEGVVLPFSRTLAGDVGPQGHPRRFGTPQCLGLASETEWRRIRSASLRHSER